MLGLGGGALHSEHVGQSVVLLLDFECCGIWDFCVWSDGEPNNGAQVKVVSIVFVASLPINEIWPIC